MIADLGNILQDRNGDGVIDYVNATIYLPDAPNPQEIAAAANIAARLAFETLSLDLPIALPISAYKPSDGRYAIAIGRAASGISREATLAVALPNTKEAEQFARTIGIEAYKLTATQAHARPLAAHSKAPSLESFFERPRTIVLGPDVRSISVIDLAARIALETTTLRLPLVVVGFEGPIPNGAILIGRSNPLLERLTPETSISQLGTGYGRIEMIDSTFPGKSAIVIAGADDDGEAEAIRHAAERLPNAWDCGKEHLSLGAIERDIHRRFIWGSPSKEDVGIPIFDQHYDIPWEVDDALQRIADKVLPKLAPGSGVQVDLRLSESVQIRRKLELRILELLEKAGADRNRTHVRVWCAHKQGYSWFHEELCQQLKSAAQVKIIFRPLQVEGASVDSPIRWLQELYPIDDILARDLGIPVDSISFEQSSPDAEHVYEVLADNSDGKTILHATFDPKFATRSLLDSFPDFAHASVATGWLWANVDGTTVVDERIKTDTERFWDIFQSDTLVRMQEYILRLYDGKPRPECAPHFGEFVVEVEISEPDFNIGIDEERISTLEALHEDIYFQTLLFFDVLGSAHAGAPLRYPGRIIPRILPAAEGPGRARVHLSGRREPGAAPISMNIPRITGMTLQAGHRGVAQLDVRVDALCPAGPVGLSYENIDSIKLIFNDRTLTASPGDRPPYSHPRIPNGQAHSSEVPSAVQWDTPIGPKECEKIIEGLAQYPEVRPYYAGSSYLGQPVWAMDVMAPVSGKYFSQAKALVTKPSLFITGRQHANEVSSTSHILKLVELLATSLDHRKLIKRVNLIIQPMANPDGAALVEELYSSNRGFMLHAGYFGALGVDITDGQWADSPLYPEARVRADLWRTWQPDILLNPHGYPSHEWVQLFSGYSAWVRAREVILRDWWIPRGWFLPRFEYLKEDNEWAMTILDRVADAIGEVFGPLNTRMQRRYAKYGAFAPDIYKLNFYKDLLVYTSEKKPDSYSDVTRLDVITELPDEVAVGPYLALTAQAGLEFSLVIAQVLAEIETGAERSASESADETVLFLRRSAQRDRRRFALRSSKP